MTDVRWKQRFDNFDRAYLLLREVQERGVDTLSQLEKEGAIQRFELAFELAWKTLKDYLSDIGIVVKPVAPRPVLKEAYQAQIIEDGQVWIDMMLDRSQLSHTYDRTGFDDVLRVVVGRYLDAFGRLHGFFLAQKTEAGPSKADPSGDCG